MASGDLITAKYWRDYSGITEAQASSSLVAILITAASRFVKRYTGKSFLAAEYREHVGGTGNCNLWVKERPIIDVFSIRGTTRISTIQVRYTGAGNEATVEVEDNTSLILRSRVSGTMTPTTLAFSTYSTLTTLHNAIEAVSGWEAQIIATDSRVQESKELLPMQPGDALNAWLVLESADYPLDYYFWEANEGRIIRMNNVWARGTRNYIVRYVAGYGIYTQSEELRLAALPEDFRLLVADVVMELYNNRGSDYGLKREQRGKWSYERFDADSDGGSMGVSRSLRQRLDSWSRWSLT